MNGRQQRMPPRGSGMFFVAGRKPLQVGAGDVRQVGELVPEAFGWPKALGMWNSGQIEFIPRFPNATLRASRMLATPAQTKEVA